MPEPASNHEPRECSRCGTENAVAAKFCGQCGVVLGRPSSAPPRSAPRWSQPPSLRGLDFGRFGVPESVGNPVRLEVDAETAFDRITHAIQSAGGHVEWHSRPHSAKFAVAKKDFLNTSGVTVRYAGELMITPIDDQNCLVHLTLKVHWSSLVPILLGALVFSFFVVLVFPLFLPFLLLVVLLMAAYIAWFFASKMPTDISAKFVKGLPRATAAKPLGIAHHPRFGGGDAPNPVGSEEPAPVPPAPALGVADRIRQLASLRDAGAITAEEYEAKKARLLEEL